MKILIFIESLKAGGKERRVIELIKGFKNYRDTEFEIVLLSKEIHYREIFDLDSVIHYIERKEQSKNLNIFIKLIRLTRTIKPDLIHVWGNVSASYAIPAKVLSGTPLINNQITNAPRNYKSSLIYKLNFYFADLIISNSKAGLNSYLPPSYKSTVVHNGFDFARLDVINHGIDYKKKLGVSTKYIVGMAATFSELKDYNTYLEAAKEVLSQRNDVSFLCIGDGDSSMYQNSLTDNERNKILFLGKRNDVEALMNMCNIGVLITYTEGIPNSIMEFMALGKPVIVTEGGGTNELVIHNETGFLVAQQNPKDLSNRIIELIDNQEIRDRMGASARKRIEDDFGISKMVQSYQSIYDQLCVE